MEDKKEFDAAEFLKSCNNDFFKTNNSIDNIWIVLLFMIFFAFQPHMGCNESYLKGKVEAYENILKGFGFDGR